MIVNLYGLIIIIYCKLLVFTVGRHVGCRIPYNWMLDFVSARMSDILCVVLFGGNCDWEFCVHAHLYMCHFFVIVSDIFVFVVCVCVYTFIVTAGHVFIYNYM